MKKLTAALLALVASITLWGYPTYSPYSYCAGNSIVFADPNGEDIVVLNYGEEKKQHHLAMLIQDETGKWQYYSVNGNNIYIFNYFLGGRPFNDVAVGSWETPEEFFHSEYNRPGTTGDQNDPTRNYFGFTQGYRIPSTSEQDAIMREKFSEVAETEYNLIFNNCVTAVQLTMKEASLPTPKPILNIIDLISAKIFEPQYDNYETRQNWIWDMTPQNSFKIIKEMNPTGIEMFMTW